MSDFTDRLETLLKTHNLTQAALADILNVRKATISDWKRNSVYPSADIAVKIAQTLNTSVEYLITGQESSPSAAELSGLKQKIRDLAASLD